MLKLLYYISKFFDSGIKVFTLAATFASLGFVKQHKAADDKKGVTFWAIVLCSSFALFLASFANNSLVKIPNVKGYSFEEANAILVDSGFRCHNASASEDMVGDIIAQYPDSDEIAAPGAVVLVYADFDSNDPSEIPEESMSIPTEPSEFKPNTLVEIGQSIYFGSFEQDNNLDNGPEAIEWIVLKKEEGKILVISKKGLYNSYYNEAKRNVVWPSSDICSELNTKKAKNKENTPFYPIAFNLEEQGAIEQEALTADGNTKYHTAQGNSSSAKVFLLSIDEVINYIPSDDKSCVATDYAIAKGAKMDYESGGYQWWLRTMGKDKLHATCVKGDGSIDYEGNIVTWDGAVVRPAVWIDEEYVLENCIEIKNLS